MRKGTELRGKIFFAFPIVIAVFFVLGISSFVLATREDGMKKLEAKILQSDAFYPENISKSSAASNEPRIVADNYGTVYVIWVEGGGGARNIFFNTNASGNWDKPSNVTGDVRVGASGPWPNFIIDPSGKSHLVYTAVSSFPNYEIFYNVFRDGGWSGSYNVSQTYAADSGGSANPSIGFDPRRSRLNAVWIDDFNDPDKWHLYFTDKDANASQWNRSRALPFSASAYLPKIGIDQNGEAHLVWIRRGGRSSVVWYSSNVNPADENQWTDAVAISGQTYEDFCEPRMAVDSGGNVYVVWINKSSGNQEIFFRKKIQGSWESIENVSQTGASSINPDVAVDDVSGNIYVVWQERAGGKWQIFLRYFQNGQWSSSLNLTKNSSDSLNPSIAVDGFGEIHAAYADNSTGAYNIFYASTSQAISSVLPPVDVSIRTLLDGSPSTKKNILKWKKNSENDDAVVKNYRIYRKQTSAGDDTFQPIRTVAKDVFQFEDGSLSTNKKFSYYLTAIDQNNLESSPSQVVQEPSVFPPVNAAVESILDSSLSKKINILTWEEDPKNGDGDVESYRIYRQTVTSGGSAFGYVASVPGNTFRYSDTGLPTDQKYAYYLTAVDQINQECEPGAVAYEEPVFPPLNIALETIVNESLFFTEKINWVQWQKSPLNDPVTLNGYKLFRKKKGEDDASYQLLSSLSADTFEYLDRELSPGDKFSYALVAVDSDGNESKKSQAVSEN